MKLAELQARGAFVSQVPVKKSVTWVHFDDKGARLQDEVDVFVVRASYGEIEDIVNANATKGQMAVNCGLIAACIRLGDDASERLTYEQARMLDPGLALALKGAIEAVGVIEKKVNRSSGPRKSGTSSS